MYKILVKIKIAVGHRGDNSDQQSFSKNRQGALKSPETGIYISGSSRSPYPRGCKDCGDGNRDTPIEQYMNESLFCR